MTMQGHHHPERDFKRLRMSFKDACILFVLYATLIIIGGSITVYMIVDFSTLEHKELAPLFVSSAMALSG